MPLEYDVSCCIQLDLIKKISLDIEQGNINQIHTLARLFKSNFLGKEKKEAEHILERLQEYARKKKEEGDSYGMMLYASLMHFIPDVPKNWERIAALYDQAIEKGSIEALSHRAYMLEHGQGCVVDFEKAIALYEQAIVKGHAVAMNNRAFMYENGQGDGVKDFTKAIDLYEKAIQQKNPSAMYNRACLYEHGHGEPADSQKAIALYEEAIALNHAPSMYRRAYMHEHGIGGPVDLEKASVLYDKAVELNDADAIVRRAGWYQAGRGGPVDFQKAINLYEKAIKLGHPAAMFGRAYMHHQGRGCPADMFQASALYEKAMALGHLRAFYHRAFMYQQGEGGPIDVLSASRLFRHAADKNYAGAKVILNNPNNLIFYYHFLMHQNQLDEAVQLVFNNPLLLDEFFQFECSYAIKSLVNPFDKIKRFSEKYVAFCSEKDKVNSFYCDLLMALKYTEETLHFASNELADLKKYFLNKLTMGTIPEIYLIPILELTINTWYAFSDNGSEKDNVFTGEAAELLKKGVHRVISCGKEEECQDLLINIALIIGKKMYGKHYNISADKWDLSMDDVLALTLSKQQETFQYFSIDEKNRIAFFKEVPRLVDRSSNQQGNALNQETPVLK